MKEVVRSADGISVHFDVEGSGCAGSSCSSTGGRATGPTGAARSAILPKQYEVVAIDLAGHGESGDGRPAVDDARLWRRCRGGDREARTARSRADRPLDGRRRHRRGCARLCPAGSRDSSGSTSTTTLGGSRTREEIEEFMQPFRANFATATRAFVQRMFVPDSDPELTERVAAGMSSAIPEDRGRRHGTGSLER